MKRVCSGLLVLAFSLVLSPLFAAEPSATPITEDDALALFYDRNLDLIAARYNIENAQALEIVAAAIPNPTIGVQAMGLTGKAGYNSSALGCKQTPGYQCGPGQTYSFSQLIETAGKRGLRMEGSAMGALAAESDFRDAVRIFSNMVRDAYYGLLLAQQNRRLARELADHYKEVVDSNRLRLQVGDIAEADFLRIDMEALKAQSDLDSAEAAVEQAQADLAVALNWPDNSLQFEAKEQWPAIKDIGQGLSREALIDKALSLRPDLEGDKQRAEQADKELALARRLNYPDVTLTGGYTHDPGNTNLNSAFIGVSVPVPLFNQHQGEMGQAAVNHNKMRLAAEATALAIRNDVVGSLAAWKSADKVVQRFESELLGHARKVRDSSEFAYRKGAIGVLEFIDAQRSYKAVMRDYHAAAINRVNAYYDLAKSVGIEPMAESAQGVADPLQNNDDRRVAKESKP